MLPKVQNSSYDARSFLDIKEFEVELSLDICRSTSVFRKKKIKSNPYNIDFSRLDETI